MILSNFHTHTKFCDGINTPEEMIEKAISLGFSALGFSSHCYAPYCSYGLKNEEEYIKEIYCLKEEYKNKIEVYCGIEEDCFSTVSRDKYEYIIGSCHYIEHNGQYLPFDSNLASFKNIINLFNDDVETLSTKYYQHFCKYILRRKPDIIGHFDHITKFSEVTEPRFLNNKIHDKIAEKYLKLTLPVGAIYEINTGAMARGYRTSFYPNFNLLKILKQNNARIILSSDSHSAETLDFGFDKCLTFLKDFGFKKLTTIKGGEFVEFNI